MQHHLSIYTELPFYLWDSVLNKSLTCRSLESPIKKHKQGLLCPPPRCSSGLLGVSKPEEVSEARTHFGLCTPPLLQEMFDGVVDLVGLTTAVYTVAHPLFSS